MVLVLTFLGKTDAFGSVLAKVADRLNSQKVKYPNITINAFGYLAISAIDDLLNYTNIDGVITYDGIVTKTGIEHNAIEKIINEKLTSYFSLKNISEEYFKDKKIV